MSVDYREKQSTWTTPGGRQAVMHWRANTNDWNAITSIMGWGPGGQGPHDEYTLPRGKSGVMMDLGAHVGSAAVAMALDNPQARIVAVEPVPSNAALVRKSVQANGLGDRIVVVEAAITDLDEEPVTIWFGRTGTESLEHHAFIGSNSLMYDEGGGGSPQEVVVPGVSLPSLMELMGCGDVTYIKADAEGAEHRFFDDPTWTQKVQEICMEWDALIAKKGRFAGRTMVRPEYRELFAATHDVEFWGPDGGPGHLRAVRR